MDRKMNFAILLGQSEYQNLATIPACKNDIAIIRNLLKTTGKYDRILTIDDTIKTADSAKIVLSKALKKYKKSDINEVFFYFTGHGYFDGNDFYYVWKDFDQYKKNQTSLLNSEIDELIKQLSPKLYVKIVDACNSGVIHVKETESIEKFLYDSRKKFNKFYFLFSSHSEQYSLADANYSIFSRCFIQSLDKPVGKIIRYKDIIDFISDSFDMTGQQTPLFITQADFTESFCTVNNKIKKIANSIFNKTVYSQSNNIDSLSHAIKSESEKFVDFETAKKCLICALDTIESFQIDSEIGFSYTKEVKSYISYDVIPNMKDIASWIAVSGEDLYANVIYDKEASDDQHLIDIVASLNASNDSIKKKFDNYLNASKHIKTPRFFENRLELPYIAIFLTLKSKFSNVFNSSLVIVPVLSRTKIYYFYAKLHYNRVDWDEQGIDMSKVKWDLETFDFNCFTIKMKMNRLIQDKFISVLIEDLKLKYNIPPTP